MTIAPRTITVIKLGVCALALGGLALKLGDLIAPKLPAWQVLLFSALGLAGIIFATLTSLAIGQMVLHAGGKDTQWFWFAQDPKGLPTPRHTPVGPRRS